MKVGSSVAWILVAAAGAVGVVGFVEKEGPSGPESSPAVSRTVSGAGESPPSVEVVGLMLNGETRAPSQMGSGHELAFFGSFSQTRVALQLVHPKGGLIDLRNEDSSLDLFQDGDGNDLLGQNTFGGPFEMGPRIAEDGRSIVFVIGSEKRPASGAESIRARGTVELLTGFERAVDRSDVVTPTVGGKLAFGPHELEIAELGKSSWGDGWSITLRSQADLAANVSYAWHLEDGTELALNPSMSMSGMGTWQQTLDCEQELTRGRLVIESWKDPEVLRVPFDVEARLGF